MSKNEILANLVARQFYVIEPCELRVKQVACTTTFWVHLYQVSDNKQLGLLNTWLLSLDEIKNIACVMNSNFFSSKHSKVCWDDALSIAREFKNNCHD